MGEHSERMKRIMQDPEVPEAVLKESDFRNMFQSCPCITDEGLRLVFGESRQDEVLVQGSASCPDTKFDDFDWDKDMNSAFNM